jgi:hypothetical protein
LLVKACYVDMCIVIYLEPVPVWRSRTLGIQDRNIGRRDYVYIKYRLTKLFVGVVVVIREQNGIVSNNLVTVE